MTRRRDPQRAGLTWRTLLVLAPLLVLVAGVAISFTLDRRQVEAAEHAADRRFAADADKLVDTVEATVERYEGLNPSIAEAVEPPVGQRSSAEEFSTFADSLILASRFPAAFGVAWADSVPRANLAEFLADPSIPVADLPDLRPDASRDRASVVTFGEPDSTMAIARGVDAQTFPPIAEALDRAARTGKTALSEPMELPLRVGPDRDDPPVLMFLLRPYYDVATEAGIADHQQHIRGWAATVLDMENFAELATSSLGSRYALRIDDLGKDLAGEPLAANEAEPAPDGRSTTVDRELFGRRWRFEITEAGGAEFGDPRPNKDLLTAGLLATATVFFVVLMLTWSERRAQRLVVRATKELATRASTDELTGLANRAELRSRLADLIADEAGRARGVRDNELVEHRGSLLFMDLDNFKLVNDSLGHSAGDTLLKQVAGRLQSVAGEDQVVARLGGDEFVVLMPGADQASAVALAEQIITALEAPFVVSHLEIFVLMSIGVISVTTSSTPDQLLQQADAAMYAAKSHDTARTVVFSPELLSDADDRLAVANDLWRGLELDQFRLVYQPILHLDSHEPVGFEALLRWNHPTRGELRPGAFLPVAVETGAITQIDRWARRVATSTIASWSTESLPWVSVNVSARELADESFASELLGTLDGSGLDPNRLIVEITETDLARDADAAAATLATLRSHGVRIAVDDFGTGYSGLSNLRRLPADVLKIDRSLVSTAPHSSEARAVLHAIVDLGHALGLKVIAEGVETEEHARVLRELGCDCAQGWYLGREMSAEQAAATLGATTGARANELLTALERATDTTRARSGSAR